MGRQTREGWVKSAISVARWCYGCCRLYDSLILHGFSCFDKKEQVVINVILFSMKLTRNNV